MLFCAGNPWLPAFFLQFVIMKKIDLTEKQRDLLVDVLDAEAGFAEEKLLDIASGAVSPLFLSESDLLSFLQAANALYRAGYPLLSDEAYDFTFLTELRRRNPQHPYLLQVEAEPVQQGKTVELPMRMLSTDKAYDLESIRRWGRRIEKAAQEKGIDFTSLVFRGTPKLDGFAAYDDGRRLYTRGDGKKGTDVSRAFARGLQVSRGGSRGLGAGEIVVNKDYFTEHLAQFFDNSRNFQASLIKEKTLALPVVKAIEAGAAIFFPFSMLPDWRGSWLELLQEFEEIVEGLWQKVPYEIDGVVFEIIDEGLREVMGATRHHHRWQIAFKKNTEIAEVTVLRVRPQTSRLGRVNPVAEVEPTRLSGALIQRVTAHHYAMVRDRGIGPGARIRMSRSGEVIPKIEEVVKPVAAAQLDIPAHCPSCGSDLAWDGDYLFCLNNMSCPAQITNSMEHFFKILGNVDGFGPSSVQRLYEGGLVDLPALYAMESADFEQVGFGPKQATNMVEQLNRSREELIEDWRFLAAFGVHRLGMGNCEKLLRYVRLEDVFNLSEEQIVAEIKGFQEKTAHSICAGLAGIKDLFFQLFALGFKLEPTPLLAEGGQGEKSPISGKTIVFTGAMLAASRGDMEKQAKALGATVGKSITGKTDMLVTGQRVGATKMAKAETLGIAILSEEAYRQLVSLD
ncbi:related to NAD-dependent DNA ligase [Desulfotalea psychrophila LSv54]|uniref:DNA ligase n=2 Tax=Desulfotalea psychrophila TaxID=84980 RepID=DNLJ_DESPS|nr:RecName: Full=DNA ligase; AltName: Full=Polydeoxyribonucleotide synthase [NAD(+)] [Desulfotalea psychrophila LSv54]CAG35735.1 related to NAD-dependent DNA ligase [Desulfotalea psychrophila LSv54]